MKDLNTKFIEELSKIKTPEVFLGVARILQVKLVSEEKDNEGKFIARSFEDVCADVITAFGNSDRRRKRELLPIIQKANRFKEDKVNKEDGINADRTKDSEASISD